MTSIKAKAISAVSKFSESKIAKGIERVATVAGVGLTSVGATILNASAAEGISISANASQIMETATPFIEAGVPILMLVAGLKFGVRFLKGATR